MTPIPQDQKPVDAALELSAIRRAYTERTAETQGEIAKALVEANEAKAELARMTDVLKTTIEAHVKEVDVLRERFRDDLERLQSERNTAIRERDEARDRHIAELTHVVEELAGVRVDSHSLDKRAEGVLSRVSEVLDHVKEE